MKMFGINRYVALSLIALTLGLWTWVTYRVVNYGHLKETVAQQKSTIDTANRASQAVAEAERRIATDQTSLDAELCRRGWMARCPSKHPLILQFVNIDTIGQESPRVAPLAVGDGGSTHGRTSLPQDGARPSPPSPPQPTSCVEAAPTKPKKQGRKKAKRHHDNQPFCQHCLLK